MGYRRSALLKRKPAFAAPEITLAPPPLLRAPAPQSNVAAQAQPQTEQAAPEQEIQPIGHDFGQITIYEDQRSAAPATPTPPAAPAAPPSDGDASDTGASVEGGADAAASHQIALPSSGMVAQTALRVNEPGDPFEQEADQLADRVMQMPSIFAPGQAAPEPAMPGMQVQRSADAAGGDAPPAVEAGVARLQGGGAPLPASERAFFEPRMGVDLSQVRIQDNSEAAAMSQALNARAFTVGSTIAFDLGEYRPGTETGRHLLAHELVHTVQQTGGVAAKRADLSIQRTTWQRDDPTIWSTDFGRQYEELYGANIAGNYPTIDHFDTDSGTAVSLKTINLINNYQLDGGSAQLRSTILGYINDLRGFIPRSLGDVEIEHDDVKSLCLQIAIPPQTDCPKPDLYDEAMQWNGRTESSDIALNLYHKNKGRTRGAKKLRLETGEANAEEEATRTPITLKVVIEERADLAWGPSPGQLYEEACEANIGGNFPVIDDFRDGTATSLKTVNIVENYVSQDALRVRIDEYIKTLAEFKGARWNLGNNHSAVDSKLIQKVRGKDHICITENQIEKRVLQIAIPPVSTLLDQENRLFSGKTQLESATDKDKQVLRKKYDYISNLNGKELNGVLIKIEEKQ
ncbi:MAG TPA: DUF4157 domain-containing protein [Roseiflexaceae bacterium]|nr:DUF4157 domain-containing protein [Roseiflexaceae bacterium]